MTKTTIEKLKYTAKETMTMSDGALTMFIEDAFLEVEETGFPEKHQERANRYLAAHMATLNEKHVKSEEVGPIKKSYGGKNGSFQDLKSTAYGQEYARLVKEYTRGNGLNLEVI